MKPLNEDRIHFFEPTMRPAIGWYFAVAEGWFGPFTTEDDARQAYESYESAEVGSAITMKGLIDADS